MFQIKEILQLAIQMEENGERVYRDAISMVGDPDIRSMLAWIADEEVAHADHFREMLQKADSAGNTPLEDNPGEELLSDIIQGESLSLKEVDFSTFHRVGDLMSVFMEFENDGILFYELLKSFILEENAKAVVDEIIDQEKRHLEKLTVFSETDSMLFHETAT